MAFELIRKLKQRSEDPQHAEPVSFAVLGDSVTQGCFEVEWYEGRPVEPVYESRSCYGEKLKTILERLYPKVPVTLINAGISGDSAAGGAERVGRDVLKYQPNLVIVSFGLNDCGNGAAGLPAYRAALQKIFAACRQANTECIFLTENFLCLDTAFQQRGDLKELAKRLSGIQKEGGLREYMEAAKAVAKENGVTVCDAYRDWELLQACGVHPDEHLSNGLNHPTREMHWLFAVRLAEVLFEQNPAKMPE